MVALNFKQNALILVVSGMLKEHNLSLETGLSQAMETVVEF